MTARRHAHQPKGPSALEEMKQESAASLESLNKALGLMNQAVETMGKAQTSRVKWGGKVVASNAPRPKCRWGKKQL